MPSHPHDTVGEGWCHGRPSTMWRQRSYTVSLHFSEFVAAGSSTANRSHRPPLNAAFECMGGTPTLLGWCPTRQRHVIR